jgi:hypothetical protein
VYFDVFSEVWIIPIVGYRIFARSKNIKIIENLRFSQVIKAVTRSGLELRRCYFWKAQQGNFKVVFDGV